MRNSTMTAVRAEFEEEAPGTPVPTWRLLRHGTRAAVDQSLARLVRSGEIKRAARGVYYRPKTSRLVGEVPPEPRAVLQALSENRGETVAPHGAEAANQLGLSTQVPLSQVLLTSGRTRTMQVGGATVRLQHASPKELRLAGRPAGAALSALRYLGPSSVTPEAIAQVRAVLPEAEFEVLRAETVAMPMWLSDAFYRFEHQEKVEAAVA